MEAAHYGNSFYLACIQLNRMVRFQAKARAYMSVNLLLTAIFFAAIMYYKYYGVIVTYHALEQVNQVTAVSNSVFSLMDLTIC